MRMFALAVFAVALPASGDRMGCAAGSDVEVANGDAVELRVVPDDGRWVVGACHPVGSRLRVGTDPANRQLVRATGALEEPCEVRAYRFDGKLRVRSAPLVLEPGASGVRELRLPDGPVGGVGVYFTRTRGGIHVDDVQPHTPAWGVLERGDRIVEVDGVRTSGLSSWEFIDRMVGAPGSEVTVGVETFDGMEQLTFVRQRIR